jgi:hypothetical protein
LDYLEIIPSAMNKTPIGIKIKFGLKMPWLTAICKIIRLK